MTRQGDYEEQHLIRFILIFIVHEDGSGHAAGSARQGAPGGA